MLTYDYRHRVRYRECDPMGVVYHSHYLDYFEAARTDALRSLGLPYAELERDGIQMPVIEVHVRYHGPARYDDVLIVRSIFPDEKPLARVNIDYEVFRESEPASAIVTGRVALCFVDTGTGRPRRAPQRMIDLFASTEKNAQRQ